MPLRDHFRPPVWKLASWEGFNDLWPAIIVQRMVEALPRQYAAEPRVHLGLPGRKLTVDADLAEQYAYEVLIFDQSRPRQLVAAVAIVCPANKDRPENRRAFITKCAALLQQGGCVSMVDPVTTCDSNLYTELLSQVDRSDPALLPNPPSTYAVTCRCRKIEDIPKLETWAYPLVVGQPLPKLPVWLCEDQNVMLDLESSYEETCRVLRIP